MNQRYAPPTGSPIAALRGHADFRARNNATGLGAAVISSSFKDGSHRWECIVSDGHEWHYVTVLGPELGPYPGLSAQTVASGIERFAGRFPPELRMRAVLNANPLHIDHHGVVAD